MFVSVHNPTIDKLVIIAGGDISLVSEAIHANAVYIPARWWRRERTVADLKAVVDYIVHKSNKDKEA